MASADSTVWLGAPMSGYKMTDRDEGDVTFSKIGGSPSLYREPSTSLPAIAVCPSCGKSAAVRLVCQLFAPMDVFDRVIYVFHCDKCSTKTKSFLYVYRSQCYNSSYDVPVKVSPPVQAVVDEKRALFEEDDDWGDGETTETKVQPPAPSLPTASPASEAAPAATAPRDCTNYSLCPSGAFPSNYSRKHAMPTFGLEIFEEPQLEPTRGREKSAEEQLAEVESKNPGSEVVDRTSVEEDDESPEERCSRKFIERIGAWPSQCVRWCPGGQPLLCMLTEPPPLPVPPCEVCGSERSFEFQLMPPAIYFLTRGLKEDEHTLHFGTALVYTCRGQCCTSAYAKELCFVQAEI